MAQKEEEQEKLPEGLKVDKDSKQVTITLGDGVDLNKIIEYLIAEDFVYESWSQPYKNGGYVTYYGQSDYKFIFTINGNDQQDKYSVSIKQHYYNAEFHKNKEGRIVFNISQDRRAGVQSDIIWLDTDSSNDPYYVNQIQPYILKDKKGNLSWYQMRKDGKMYMRNHLENKNRIADDNDFPEPEPDNQWKPIKHTYGSNITAWWKYNIDDYDKIEEDDRPSSMKRLGRVLIGQDNMTGECLWGHGCLSCCGSRLNEEPFYSTINVNNDKIKAS